MSKTQMINTQYPCHCWLLCGLYPRALNNSKVGDDLDRIHPIEHEVKNTTYRAMSASYLGINLEIDSEGRLRNYDKRDDFNFPIVNICQLIRACGFYHDFPDRWLLL